MLRTVQVTRYVTPLREGGSLPAIAGADDGFLYVLKFRGAGQGTKALIADLLGAELARLAGFKVPELVFAELDEAFGRTEPDEEIQDLLKASVGLNLAVHYLSGAITFDSVVMKVPPLLASQIVWVDAFITNVDRTVRNTNMLIWNKELWLIDFGASLYFHHAGVEWEEAALKPFAAIKDHVLLPQATMLKEVDEQMKLIFTTDAINKIVSLLPDTWLMSDADTNSAEDKREIYRQFLNSRCAHSSIFLNEALHAQQTLI